MKPLLSTLLSTLLLALLAAPLLTAEVSLWGEAKNGLNFFLAFPYNESRFQSPLNPDNYQGLRDLNLSSDLLAKLSAEEEKAGLNFWLAVKPYALGQALLAAASGDPVQTGAVAESISMLGPQIDVIDVLRANIGWYIADFLILKIGRQSMLSGYGYGWNPMDFFNPLKDPFDPDQELTGVDALSVQYYLGNLFTFKLAGIYRPQALVSGVDFNAVQAGAELTASLPALELKLTGFYDYDETQGEDGYVPAVGAGVKADIAGIGIYGEGALLGGSRNYFPSQTSTLARKQELLFSALAGLEYTFAGGFSATVEYFYNGEGYNLAERTLYKKSLLAAVPYPPVDLLRIFRPGYFARHYLAFYLYIPLYDLDTDLAWSLIYSPDSWSLTILPSLTLNLTGSLSAVVSYLGMISLDDKQYNEAWLTPVRHLVQLELRYSF